MNDTTPAPSFQMVSPHLATAGQPTAEHLARLKEAGFEAVINVSTPTARNFVHEEADLAARLGLRYVHIPVDCSRLEPWHYETVRAAIAANAAGPSPVKTLVHCAANVKSSALVHIYRVRELGHDAARSREDLGRLGGHEPKWFDYFERMGA